MMLAQIFVSYNDAPWLATIAVALLLAVCATTLIFFKRVFGAEITAAWSVPWRVLLVLVACAAGIVSIIVQASLAMDRAANVGHGLRAAEPLAMLWFFACGALFFFGVILATKLYEKLVASRLSVEERTPGSIGLRAWLALPNFILIVGIALGAWIGYDYSFWGILSLGLLAIIAYPAIIALLADQSFVRSERGADVNLSPERDRVMRLLEQGKITADESAELLNALAVTLPPPPPVEPFTPTRKLMLGGAALVLIGFFVPWFSINPMDEIQRISTSIGGANLEQAMSMFGSNHPAVRQAIGNSELVKSMSQTVYVSGGDIEKGLGWIILALGVGAAAVPYALTGLSKHSQRQAIFAVLAIGGVITIYLLTRDISHLSVGLPLVLAGYLVEIAAMIRENRIARPMPVQAIPATL